jgi:hypothetical protein
MVAVVTLLLLCAWSVNAQTVQLRFTGSFSSQSSRAMSTGDVLYAIDATAMSTSTSNVVFPSPNNFRVQLKEIALQLVSTSASAITVHGMSSGTTSTRTIFQVHVGDAATGPWTLLDDVTTPGTNITSTIYGQAVATSTTTVTGLNIAKGKFVKISFCTSSSGGSTQNVNISGFDITPAASGPIVEKTSGSNPASAMETVAMTPVVYTYANVADDANVLADWYTDNTYTSTTSAPAGLTINKNTTAKTVTVSGTPTTAGTYYYKVAVTEEGGNAIEGVVNVSAYVTPAPQFTLTTGNNNQYPVKETAIASIVYTIANATGANTTGLPAGLAGVYDNGTYTISGTLAAEAATGVYNYTVTATPLVGYSGADVTATGKIVVKSPTAKQICYLVAAATPSANDTKLYPMLMDDPNFIVNLRTAASSAPAASVYDSYDLIILNEIVGGTNAEAVALKNVDKPILSLKAFTYTSGRWSWGTPNNGLAANGVITAKQPAHPVFNGITLDGGNLSLVDNASGNTVQVNDVTSLPGRSIVVASAPKSDNVMAVAVHDVPADVRGVTNSKYILIPIADANYHRMNNNVLTMINNAIDYLLNGAQFQAPSLEIASITHAGKNGQIDHTEGTVYIPVYVGTDLTAVIPEITLAGVGTSVTPATAQNFSNSKATPLIYTVSDMISTKQYAVTIEESTSAVNEVNAAGFVFDGSLLRNVSHEMIRVYDTTGRMMTSSLNDIDMSQFGQGIYIIRSDSKVLKIAITH